MMNKTGTNKRRYMTGIDGLRAIAVIGVIIYHLNYEWLPGGFLGVTIFFVLSGYLITDLLLEEWNKKGKIDFIDFWIRRFRRLLPALIFLMFILTIWILLFKQEAIGKLQADFLPSLLYVTNWWYIFKDISYFETFGMPSPFTHLWSLAVEEQFYIIWPILFFIIVKLFKKNSVRLLSILIIAMISAFLMAFIYVPGLDPSRVYYGTDTRAFSLLIGSMLAIIWPSQKLSKTLPSMSRIFLDITGLLGLALIVIMFYFSSQYDNFLYRGGMVLLSIYTALLVACLAHPASLLGKIFSIWPLRWIGTRSYAIYLWHYPIIILTTPNLYSGEVNMTLIFWQMLATIVMAELSYVFIEKPVRKGAYRKLLYPKFNARLLYRRGAMLTAVCLCYLFMSGTTYAIISQVEHKVTYTQINNHQLKEENLSKKNEVENEHEQKDEQKSENEKDVKGNVESEGTEEQKDAIEKSITIIGDSIIYDVTPHFLEVFPHAIIDYSVGRQMIDVPEVIEQLRAKGKLGEYIVLEIGTNGPFEESTLSTIIDSLNEAEKIFVVNTRVPRPWQNKVNETIRSVVGKKENVILVDWYKVSKDQPSYFGEDGVHLTSEGGKAFSDMLVDHINDK